MLKYKLRDIRGSRRPKDPLFSTYYTTTIFKANEILGKKWLVVDVEPV